jgi:inner membrane protein
VPTILSHAVAGAAIASASGTRARVAAKLWIAVAIAAALPDIDVVAFTLGIPYGNMFGHRGLTHSLVFAALMGLVIVKLLFAREGNRLALVLLFFVVIASHGVLDAMTDGGLGVAFFAPFSAHRYFFTWRPIRVSPIGLGFFSYRGERVLLSEIYWVWVPSAALLVAGMMRRRRRS